MAIKNDQRSYEFVMSFLASSEQYRRPYTDRWREIAANFMVEPLYGEHGTMETPYRQGRIYTSRKHQVILKDPETHKVVMTYAAKLVRSLFGDRNREYIKAKPRGWEDAPTKSETVSRLLRYSFALPGTFRTLVEAVIDMLLYGTFHDGDRRSDPLPTSQKAGAVGLELQAAHPCAFDDGEVRRPDLRLARRP